MHYMTTLEFINGMTKALAWPALIVALLIYYRDKLAEFAFEMMGVKFQAKLVKEGEGQKVNAASLAIKSETAYYKLYSNGLLVQNIKIRIAPGIEKLSLVYPISFPNEMLAIQAIGDDVVWPLRVSLGNCDLKITPSSHEREIQFRISGM
jgi:hypothetical protein